MCGRFLVPRVALLALPEGPVPGIDLARGASIALSLLPIGADPADRLDAGGGRGAGTHLGRAVVVSEPAIPRPAPALPPRPGRTPARAALVGEARSRRGRVTLAAGALVAGVLVCSSLLGGTRSHARAASLRPLVPAPARVVHEPPARARRAAVHVPVRAPSSRGGAARVLERAPVPPPVSVPIVRQVPSRPSVAPRSPGWVDGLVVGS